MKKLSCAWLASLAMLLFACQPIAAPPGPAKDIEAETAATVENKAGGYVLRKEEGEYLPGFDSALILKVSPEMGSQSIITLVAKLKPGSGTGFHYHKYDDEIFYVVEGLGNVILDNKSYAIETGDLIFIPKNVEHKIQKKDSVGILKVLFFMDKPGLLKEFREEHQQFFIEKKPKSLESLNEIAEKYGTHYRTID